MTEIKLGMTEAELDALVIGDLIYPAALPVTGIKNFMGEVQSSAFYLVSSSPDNGIVNCMSRAYILQNYLITPPINYGLKPYGSK